MKSEVVESQDLQVAVPQTQAPEPGQIIAPVEAQDKWERLMQVAIERGGGAEQFAMLVEAMMKARREDARLQFEEALGRFKTHLPNVLKTKKVSYENKDGTVTEYWHSELDKVSKIIGEELQKEGLAHTWRPSEGANGRTLMTCVFRHTASGHVEDMATLGGPPDTSGGKNSVQAIGSTTYYLQRYTLLAASGIVARGIDDDGQSSEPKERVAPAVAAKHMNQIEAATNDIALKQAFEEAINEAKALGDAAAQAKYNHAKNKRYREIHAKVSPR